MATFRKRNSLWQAQVRSRKHGSISWDSNSNQVVDIYGLDKDENQIIEKLFIDKNENGIAELTVILGASLPKPMPGIIYAFDENEDETIDGYGHVENEDGQLY